MGTTPLHDLPYPEGSDPPAGHAQMRALAEAVEGALPLIQRGRAPVAISNAPNGNATVTFPRPYASPPTVVAVPDSNSFMMCVVGPITATTFRVDMRDVRGSNRNDTQAVFWIAVGPGATP
jgi:hypothetical protein